METEFLQIPHNSLVAMAAVLGVLLLSSIVATGIHHRNPGDDSRELVLRVRSWWWIILIVFAALLLGTEWAIVLFGAVSFMALKEFLSLVPTRQVDRQVIFLAYLAIPIQYYWIGTDWYGMFTIFVPIYLFLFFPARMVLIGETDGFIRAASVIQWATMLTVFCVSHVAALLMLPVQNEAAGAIGLVLFLLIFTELGDVAQYVWGKTLGRHKIMPKVSPNKTWEGFIGGVVTLTVCGYFAGPFLTPLVPLHGAMAGAIIGVAGFIGDVVMSSVKRDLHIKDTGTMIPGHGGLLDRLDSLAYSAPFFFHFTYYVYF